MLGKSHIDFFEFKEGLQNIPEPPKDRLNPDHLESPYNQLVDLTNEFTDDLTTDILADLVTDEDHGIEFLRYMVNESQTKFSENLTDHAPYSSFDAQTRHIRSNRKDAESFAAELLDEYEEAFESELTIARSDIALEKLLEERYTEKRRAGLEGQQHGSYIEDQVVEVLTDLGLSEGDDYFRDRQPSYSGSDKDVDFLLPGLKTIVECKGYVTSGSKLYDAVGDVSKIAVPDGWHLFLVLDGHILADQTGLLRDFQTLLADDDVTDVYQISDMNVLQANLRRIQKDRDINRLQKSIGQMQADLCRIPTEELELSNVGRIFRALDILNEHYSQDAPVNTLATALTEDAEVLTVLRMVLDKSQDRFATELHQYIPEDPGYDKLLDLLAAESGSGPDSRAYHIAEGLYNDEEIDEQVEAVLQNDVTYFDIVATRYMQKAGKAIKSQYTGNYLEDKIQDILEGLGLKKNENFFRDQRAEFTVNGRTVKTTKGADFVAPSLVNPGFIIEAKGYSSTGSKQTDAAGDIREKLINQIPEDHRNDTKVILVTDGGSWRLRQPDLKKLIDLHNDGELDGMYQLQTLDQFEQDLQAELPMSMQDTFDGPN